MDVVYILMEVYTLKNGREPHIVVMQCIPIFFFKLDTEIV